MKDTEHGLNVDLLKTLYSHKNNERSSGAEAQEVKGQKLHAGSLSTWPVPPDSGSDTRDPNKTAKWQLYK